MNSAKELVREKMPIQDVIGSYITLVPAGKNYKACCPFHIEKTPSFQVNTEKQMFYCFGCKKGGDIFSFVQEIEHCDFKEALKILADKAGIDIHQSAELAKELQTKKKLIQIHEFATRFYQLYLSQNTTVAQYLQTRGLNSGAIKQWRIGYAPDDFKAFTTYHPDSSTTLTI
jgi:DNA primase